MPRKGRPLIDITGQKFGRLTVVRRAPNRPGSETTFWECRCECGNTSTHGGPNLKNGTTQSCGCLLSESRKTRSRTHGMKHTPEWRAWSQARARCRDVNHQAYKWYGARGIYVCERWNTSFEAFYEDMGPRPTPRHSLDRIDTNGPYNPENCRWATWDVQHNNKRNNVRLTLDGKTATASEWSKATGISPSAISTRQRAGHTVTEVLDPNMAIGKRIEFNGERHTVREWAEQLGIHPSSLRTRIQRWGVERALTRHVGRW